MNIPIVHSYFYHELIDTDRSTMCPKPTMHGTDAANMNDSIFLGIIHAKRPTVDEFVFINMHYEGLVF